MNKIFFSAFLLWSGYIIINSVIYLIAANSIVAFEIATILHRIGVCIAVIFALLMYAAALVVKEGQNGLKLMSFRVSSVLLGILCIIALFTQEILIVDQTGSPLISAESWSSAEIVRVSIPITIITGTILAIPIVFFILAIFYLLQIVSKGVSDPELKMQMIYMIIGIIFLALGMIYFVAIQLFDVVNIITATIGHLIWTISPIAIWKSQKK